MLRRWRSRFPAARAAGETNNRKEKPMKEKLLELAFEYLLTPAIAKKLARALNAKLQKCAALSDGKVRIAGYLRDFMATGAVYSEAVADDGTISDAELANINAHTDALVDKYFPKEG